MNDKIRAALIKQFRYMLDTPRAAKNPGFSSHAFAEWYSQWNNSKKLQSEVDAICAEFVTEGVLVPFGGYRDYVYWIQRDHDIFKDD